MDIYEEKRTVEDLLRRREFKTRSELWIRCDESLLRIPTGSKITSLSLPITKGRVVDAYRLRGFAPLSTLKK